MIVNFTSGNQEAEFKIQAQINQNNGRSDHRSLKEHYEGVGVYAIEVTRAKQILKTLFYSGEKKPYMWWTEFECQLTAAFVSFDRQEGRIAYSNEMKLRILNEKVNADFLAAAKAGINMALTAVPMTMTYARALQTFRNEVIRKFPPQMTNVTRTRRNINEVIRSDGRGRGRSRNHGGRGR